jgi:hypothetical protein
MRRRCRRLDESRNLAFGAHVPADQATLLGNTEEAPAPAGRAGIAKGASPACLADP